MEVDSRGRVVEMLFQFILFSSDRAASEMDKGAGGGDLTP